MRTISAPETARLLSHRPKAHFAHHTLRHNVAKEVGNCMPSLGVPLGRAKRVDREGRTRMSFYHSSPGVAGVWEVSEAAVGEREAEGVAPHA